MRFLIGVGVAAILLALALAVRAPATLVDVKIKDLSSGIVRLSDATGTIWNGAGQLTLPGGTRVPVAWKIDALPMLHGELAGTLDTSAGGGTAGTFSVDGQRFSLRNFTVALPAETLLRAAGVPEPFAAAGGVVDVHIETLSRRDDGIDGSLTARWTSASLPGPRPGVRVALGDVRADAAGQGRDMPGAVANTGGDVDIAGNIIVSANGARGDVVVRPRAGIDAERSSAINAALMAVGQRDASGGYRLTWSTGTQ